MPEYRQNWDELAQSMADGEAVLVLGPDAIPLFRNGPPPANDPDEPAALTFSDLTRRRILQTLGGNVSYFYPNDNLFLFRDADAKNQAQKIVKRCANDPAWLPDVELIRHIVALNVPVVLSLSPDDYVRQALSRYGVLYQFDYFSAKDKTTETVLAAPKAGQPLLYNLCGYALEDDYDSVVLDYEDLFGLLTALLGDLNVPDVLRSKLKKANRFVLLGFHLERWYMQLLLHYINKLENAFDNRKHNFVLLTDVSDDARRFVMEQFQVKCIAPDRAELDLLIAACARCGALRALPDPLAGPAAEIRLLVEKDDLPAALDLLGRHAAALGDPTIVPLLKARYTEWLKHYAEKTLDPRDLDLRKNQLRSSILTFSAQLT